MLNIYPVSIQLCRDVRVVSESVARHDTVTALQRAHLEDVIASTDDSEFALDDAGSFIAQESDELVDTEGGDEPMTQASLEDATAQYLSMLRENV